MDALVIENMPEIKAMKDRAFAARDAFLAYSELGDWASDTPEAEALEVAMFTAFERLAMARIALRQANRGWR